MRFFQPHLRGIGLQPESRQAERLWGFRLLAHNGTQAEVAKEKLATCHSEGRCLPEESAVSWKSRRKADPSLRPG